MFNLIPDKTLADLIAITADFASEPIDFTTLAALRELQMLRTLRSEADVEETMKDAWGVAKVAERAQT